MRSTSAVICVVLSMLAGVAPAAFASEQVEATVPLRWVAGERHAEIVEGSSQTTVATAEGASMTVVTNGLKPGYTYTLWFTFFNHPEHCRFTPPIADTTLRCGLLDLLNPQTDGSLVYGDGLVATGANDTFEGYRPIDEFPEGEEQIAYGTGILTNPLGAEYQATLRSHGPEDPEYMPAQIETLNGGCHEGEPYHPCRDPQASGFRWQFPFECAEAVECAFTEDENPLG